MHIEYRRYKCEYPPICSPEVKPIEQFWTVVNSKLKRHRFLLLTSYNIIAAQWTFAVSQWPLHGFPVSAFIPRLVRMRR